MKTSMRDKDCSNEILILGSVSFYACIIAAAQLADADNLASLASVRSKAMRASVYDKDYSNEILLLDCVSFNACIMAAIQLADTDNLAILANGFPQIFIESVIRYNAPAKCASLEEWISIHGRVESQVELLQLLFDNATASAQAALDEIIRYDSIGR